MQQALLVFLIGLAAAGCQAPSPGDADEGGDDPGQQAATAAGPGGRAPAYVDVQESFTDEGEQNRWFELTRALRQDFDDICGDTFCEGDFTNLEALSFRCSVSARTGLVKNCLWLFAGSYETVTGSTGTVRPVARFFRCPIPVVGTPAALLDALLAPEGRGPLWRPLPGSPGGPERSAYDALGDCL